MTMEVYKYYFIPKQLQPLKKIVKATTSGVFKKTELLNWTTSELIKLGHQKGSTSNFLHG